MMNRSILLLSILLIIKEVFWVDFADYIEIGEFGKLQISMRKQKEETKKPHHTMERLFVEAKFGPKTIRRYWPKSGC